MKRFLLSFILASGIIVAGCGTQKVELPVDETAPSITISSPADNAVIQENKVTVRGTVSDDGSGVKSVTLSGGGKSATATPDANGNFSAELTDLAEGTINIVAQATDEQGNSASAGVKVLIDLSAPTVSLITPTSGQYLKGTVTLSASAGDTNEITQVEFLRGTTVLGTDTTSPYSINFDTTTVTDGNYSFTARATDSAGRTASSTAASATVDNSAPTVAITSPANGSYARQSITVSANASDTNGVVLVIFSVDGTVFASDSTNAYSVVLNTTTLTEGAHTLTATAIDTAGNLNTSANINITVDNSAPTTSITAPSSNAYVRGTTVSVTANASDVGSSITEVAFYCDGSTQIGTDSTAPYEVTWDTTTTCSTDGPHSLTSVATDSAGNTTTSVVVPVTVDNTNPSVGITTPSNGSYVRGTTVTVSASAGDNIGVASVQFFCDGATSLGTDTTAPYSVSWDTTTTCSTNAAHILTAVATDLAGNQTTSANVGVAVDNQAPIGVAVTSPANGSYVRQSITVTASASDNNSVSLVEFLVDGGVFASDSSSPYSVQLDTTTLSDGAHTLSARAIDIAGNQTTSANINITVDNSAPTTCINSPICGNNVCNATEAPGGFVATAITVTTNAENGQTVTLFSNGNPIGTGTVSGGSATITQTMALTEGSNNLVAGVTDLAGNSNTSASVNVTLDTTVNIAIVFPSNNQWMNNTWDYDTGTPGLQLDVTVTTDAETGQTVTVYGGDVNVTGPVSNGSAIIRVTFSTEGTKNLTADVYDSAGNYATTGIVTVYYDTTAPTVTITLPVANQLFKSTCPGGTGTLCQPDNDPATPLFQTTVTIVVADNMATQAQMAGTTVNIYSNGNLVGSGPLVALGPTTIPVSLRDGGNALTATLSDLANNTGTSSAVKTYVFVGTPGTITGWVYNPCDGSWISGATVELSQNPQYDLVLSSAITDVGGVFTLQNVPPGEYENIRACLDRDGNGMCEIKNGFGPDGEPGIAGVDDDGINGVDNCGEYQNPPLGDDTLVDFIGYYNFSSGNGPIQVRPGAGVSTNTFFPAWIGNRLSGPPGLCTITGQISDTDTSWTGVNTIVGTLDLMLFGEDFSPVNVRTWTSVPASTTPQPFTLYEQPFAPSDAWPMGGPFLLWAGKDLNGNGRPDLNSEPFIVFISSIASCGSSGLNFTLQPRAQIQGSLTDYTPGWVVNASPAEMFFGGGPGPGTNMTVSSSDVNPDGTYSLTVFGNNTYIVMATKDRNGFYLDQDNELSVFASIFPISVETGTIGGVNITLPPVRTISGTVSGTGISNWAVNAGAYNQSMRGWIEPTSNYYLLEVLPDQYWLNVFNDRNANLDFDPREGGQDYGSKVDVGTSSASGINIAVTPDIILRNVFIDDPAPGGDGDRLAEPGQTVGINVQFRNYRANATNVNATLSCVTNCAGITINAPNPLTYANINFDVLTAPLAYSVSIGIGVLPWTRVTFGINLTADGGYTNYQEFSITVSAGHRDGTPPGLPASGASVATDTNPNDVAIAVLGPLNQRAYIANYGSSSVTVINALTDSVITTIGAPDITGCPSTVATSTDGTRAYVGNNCNGNVAVIDTNTNTVIDTYDVGSNAYGVAVSPDGTELWVTNSWEYQVNIINTSTGSIEDTIMLAGNPREIVFSPDGEQVFILNIQRVTVINARNREIQGNMPAFISGWGEIGIDPYSLYLYAFDWSGWMVQVDIDTYSFTVTDFTASGLDQYASLAITPDGALLDAAEDGGDNNVYVIDIPTSTLVGSFGSGTGGNRNSAIAFTQAGNKCWVTNYNDNTATPAQ